jgi:hypothetical protein
MRLRRVLKLVGNAVGVVALGIAALIAVPEPLFAYESSRGAISILSDRPIDEAGAQAVMADVEARLARSPLAIDGGTYQLIVTNEDWRRRLLFTVRYGAGGVAYYPLALNHAFLSGADFARDRLLKSKGEAIDPPRTLGYYGAHELAHVRTGERAGPVRLLLMPRWVTEGLADYAALGSPGDLRKFDAALGREPITVEQMKRYGVYPRYRMLVTYFLEKRRWTLDQLLQTDISEDEALSMLRGG